MEIVEPITAMVITAIITRTCCDLHELEQWPQLISGRRKLCPSSKPSVQRVLS